MEWGSEEVKWREGGREFDVTAPDEDGDWMTSGVSGSWIAGDVEVGRHGAAGPAGESAEPENSVCEDSGMSGGWEEERGRESLSMH